MTTCYLRRSALLALLLCCLGPLRTATAVDGASANVTLLGRLFEGEPHVVVLQDPIAFVGLDTGLATIDMTAPENPAPMGHLYLPSPAYDLTVVGSLAYIANGESGFKIVDASDPYNLTVIASLPTSGTRGVDVQGGTAYLAEASDSPASVFGLRTVDILDSVNPATVGFLPLPNGAVRVRVSGNQAYVATGSRLSFPGHGLHIVDVSSLAAPSLTSYVDTFAPVNDLVLDSGLVYLTGGVPFGGGLWAVDATTPASPALLSTTSLPDAGRGVAVQSGIAYVAASEAGIYAYDVSDPNMPVFEDAVGTGRDACAIASGGNLAFIGERSSTIPGALTTLDTPQPPATMSERHAHTFASASDVAASAGLGYFLRADALHVYEASDPNAMIHLSSWAPPGASLSSLAVWEYLAAVAQGGFVRLVDTSDPSSPVERGIAAASTGLAIDPVLEANLLYIVNGRGFDVFDVSQPDLPVPLGTYVSRATSTALRIDGSIGYLLADGDLQIIDVAVPGSPLLLGQIDLGELLYAVDVSADLAVVSGEDSSLITVDVSDPGNPALVATQTGGPGFDVALRGDRALVAVGESGLQVVDVTNPSMPVLDGFYDTSGIAAALAVDGPFVYLATGAAQHWVMSCETCVAGRCRIVVELTQPPEICEGDTVDLVAVPTTVTDCPDVDYQWYEAGTPIPGANTPTFTVPATTLPGAHDFTVTAICRTTAGCSGSAATALTVRDDSAAVVAPNSLRVISSAFNHTLSWQLTGFAGPSNVHLTLSPTELPSLWNQPGSLIGVVNGTTFSSFIEPTGQIPNNYQVYGRAACTGWSVP